MRTCLRCRRAGIDRCIIRRGEMAQIAGTLEAAGYTTFLPQRDGLEFARLLPELCYAKDLQTFLDRSLVQCGGRRYFRSRRGISRWFCWYSDIWRS
jgi:hypothetical protein